MTGAEIALFFEKWGLELILGGLGSVLTGMVIHYRKLIKKGKASEEQEKKQAFKEELTSEVKGLIKEVKDQVHAEIEQESSQVREEIAEYGHVTVGSYYSACEISPTAGDFNYGWYELRNAKVQYR